MRYTFVQKFFFKFSKIKGVLWRATIVFFLDMFLYLDTDSHWDLNLERPLLSLYLQLYPCYPSWFSVPDIPMDRSLYSCRRFLFFFHHVSFFWSLVTNSATSSTDVPIDASILERNCWQCCVPRAVARTPFFTANLWYR